jgi:hypothetical protein
VSDLPASLSCHPGRAPEARDPGSRLIDRTRSRIRPLPWAFRDGKGREEWSWLSGRARGLSPTYGLRTLRAAGIRLRWSWLSSRARGLDPTYGSSARRAVHHPDVSGVPTSLHLRSRPSAADTVLAERDGNSAREPGSSPLAVGHHAAQSVAIKIPDKTAVAVFPGTRGEREGARWSWLVFPQSRVKS